VSRPFPALDLVWVTPLDDERADQLLAEIDHEHPTAVESRDAGVRVFFASADQRRRAAIHLTAVAPDVVCTPVDVEDDQWAARSQAALEPVRVGRVVVTPPWREADVRTGLTAASDAADVVIIHPSMGFGTGHHASTRLCLRLMQACACSGAAVLDVGTGSGVLAIAASRLGALDVLAVDYDVDALQSAEENIALNRVETTVRAKQFDLAIDATALADARRFDIVLANLTGTMLEQHAATIAALVAPGGRLIVSGCLHIEADDVRTALEDAGLTLVERVDEEEWVALALTSPSASTAR
jgi:ribosomal protein L11 methyltransferase